MDGVRFGDKLSYEDYKAIMNYARIVPPSVKENYVDIAGGNSSIDLTEAVGGVVYEDGEIDFKFTLKDFELKEQMKNDLHGKRMQIVLDREPEFYYDGRVRCSKDEWNKGLYELHFTARVKPYKCEVREFIHTEEINSLKDKKIYIENKRMPVMPRITVAGTLYVNYEGMKYTFKDGVYQFPEFTFFEGRNSMSIHGNGSIKFEFRRGQLV